MPVTFGPNTLFTLLDEETFAKLMHTGSSDFETSHNDGGGTGGNT